MNEALSKTIAEVRNKRDLCNALLNNLENYAREFGGKPVATVKESLTPRFGLLSAPVAPVVPAAKRKYQRRVVAAEVAPPKVAGIKTPPVPPAPGPTLAAVATSFAPTSFSAANKRVLREQVKPSTGQELFAAIQTRWPSLCDGKDDKNVYANVNYWTSKGFLEKLGTGALATFRVLERDAMEETE